jgi:hypothetical protein
MAWFKKEKEDESLPELPELPTSTDLNFPSQNELSGLEQKQEIPEVPSGLPEIETHALPTLPESTTGERFNQQAIKQAVNTKGFQKSQFPPLQPPATKSIPPIPYKPAGKRTLEMTENFTPRSTKKAEPVFIRLDKFQAAIETFEDIKTKIIEIEDLLRKTREIKTKEEQELEEWEREIHLIKSRINTIDKNIFNKLD